MKADPRFGISFFYCVNLSGNAFKYAGFVEFPERGKLENECGVDVFLTTTTQSESSLERKRNELGFHEIGKANGIPIFTCNEKANAAEALDRAARAKLELPTYEFMLSAFGSESSLKDKFNDSGKSDYSFWITGMGRDTNHLIDESIEAEIMSAQEAGAMKLAESGMNYRDIAKKLGVTALSVYYALKKKGKTKAKKSIKPRSSALCHFDKKGKLLVGKGLLGKHSACFQRLG